MGYSTTDALARIRRAARINSSDPTYTDVVILDMLDSVIHTECVPAILKIQSDYWLTYEDIAVSAARSRYPVPTRAAFNKVNSVFYLNNDKSSINPLVLRNLLDFDVSSTGEPRYHSFLDDTIFVTPTPASTIGYIRVYYPYLPSNLVATSACMLITGGVSTGILTGVSLAGWTTALKYDIFSAESPFALVGSNLTATGVVAGVSITFPVASLDVSRLSSGSYYVSLTRQTCFPMIPQTLHNLAADMVVAKIREEIGDEGFVQKYNQNLKQLKDMIDAIVPRKDTETKPIINRSSMYRHFV